MAEAKWSTKDLKGTGVPADLTLIIDSVSGENQRLALDDIPLTGNAELKALATGILKNTTTTGTPSIAAAETDYTSPTGLETRLGSGEPAGAPTAAVISALPGRVDTLETDMTTTADPGHSHTAITVAAEAADTSMWPAFFTGATGNLQPKTHAGWTFDAATGMLTGTGFTGPVTGTASGNPALSLITAANDFIVGSGSGVAVKKTLAETKTLLGVGYPIQLASYVMSPVDGNTYYTGLGGTGLVTTDNAAAVLVPVSGTITSIQVRWFMTTAFGTTEAVTLWLRVNSSDTLISDAISLDAQRNISKTDLNIAVTAGQLVVLKWLCPTWATNPTGVLLNAIVWVSQ